MYILLFYRYPLSEKDNPCSTMLVYLLVSAASMYLLRVCNARHVYENSVMFMGLQGYKI